MVYETNSNSQSGEKIKISKSELKERILKACPKADIDIAQTGALCSFYAEDGGILVGFESK